MKQIKILNEQNTAYLMNKLCDFSINECHIGDGIIVWDENIHVNCTYEILKKVNLIQVSDICL